MMESSVVFPPATENCSNNCYPLADDKCEDVENEDGDKDISDKFRAPCLVCGIDLEATFPHPGGEGVVKQEVDVEDGNFGGDLNEEDVYQVGMAKATETRAEEDNISLYHWFLKLFDLEEKSVKKGRRVNRDIKVWWGDGELQIPFCLLCKNELIQLLEFQRKVEELEKLIHLGTESLKERCSSSELIFERKNVYQNDKRYRTIRQQIIKIKSHGSGSTRPSLSPASPLRKRKKVRVKELPPPSSPNPEVGNLPLRKSGRQPKTVVKYDPSWFEDDFSFNTSSIPGAIPMVLLSTSDKVIAEQYLLNPITAQNKSKNKSSKQNCKPSKPRIPLKKSPPTLKIDPDSNDLPTSYPEDTSFPSEDNFDDYDNHDDDIDDEDFNVKAKPTQKPKKRKPKDEDFIPTDADLQNDEDDNSDTEELLSSFKRYIAKIIHDPIQNTLTFKNITFKSVDSPEDNMYECTSCGVQVHNSKGRVRYHVIKCHTTLFACSKCNYRGGRPSDLKTHVKMVHKGFAKINYSSPCEICGKPVNHSHTKSHLWTHMNKEEKREARLKEEEKEKEGKSFLHFVVKKYQCDECGRKFSIPSTLEKHVQRVHGGDKGKVKDEELCPECGDKFTNLQIHMVKKHGNLEEEEKEGKRRWECMEPGCGKRFKDRAQLFRHKESVHRNVRPWKCNLCTRAFGKKSALENHVNLHMGIREWKCEECNGMGFARKHHLDRHRKTFHEDGSRPRRKGYMRGPTTIGMGWTKGELVRKGAYYPPSALASWAQGRVPGYLVEERGTEGIGGGDGGGGDIASLGVGVQEK